MWAWNSRRAGWEGGEYALCTRQGRPSARAVRAGQIAQAANRLGDELWQARKEPYVGLFLDWDSEAIWAAVSVPNRDHYRHWPVRARVGASRALINGNVPWEHLTANDLRRGLNCRYRVILMPAALALAADVLPLLAAYVRGGGRLVLDAPGGWFDTRGRVLDTGAGSPFERIFGAEIADFQYSNNRPWTLGGRRMAGFVFDLHPTTAQVVERFGHGAPAVTENACGDGAAVLLGCDATFQLFAPGNARGERWLLRHVLGPHTPPYACDGAIVYRLAAPEADHYFLINDDEAKEVALDTRGHRYRAVSDPVSEEPLELGAPIALEAYSARWVRFAKEERP
jgi:beta-galactosidase